MTVRTPIVIFADLSVDGDWFVGLKVLSFQDYENDRKKVYKIPIESTFREVARRLWTSELDPRSNRHPSGTNICKILGTVGAHRAWAVPETFFIGTAIEVDSYFVKKSREGFTEKLNSESLRGRIQTALNLASEKGEGNYEPTLGIEKNLMTGSYVSPTSWNSWGIGPIENEFVKGPIPDDRKSKGEEKIFSNIPTKTGLSFFLLG